MSKLALQRIEECKRTRSTFLHLGDCGLTKIPNQVYRLTWLTNFSLGIIYWDDSQSRWQGKTHLGRPNRISKIPRRISSLQRLESLSVDHNSLRDVNNLRYLKNLKNLLLARNQISDIRPLASLKNLNFLSLHGNQVSNLSCVLDMRNLEYLELGENKVSNLSFLRSMGSLLHLDLNTNYIKDFGFVASLEKLLYLNVSRNKITSLKDFLPLIERGLKVESSFKTNSGLVVQDILFKDPPNEIIEKGNEAILNYFKQIDEQGGTAPLYEAKLMIVGEPGAGKSTLKEKLVNPDYVVPEGGDLDIASTIGIKIEEGWTIQYLHDESISLNVNIWDFGGQEIQYMTHQFFITPGALYILVVDDRKQDTEYDYWFRIINLLGKEGDEKVKILVLLNQKNHKSVTNFDVNYYREQYPNLNIEQIEVDFAIQDHRCDNLRNTIQRLLSDLPDIADPKPKLWKPIRDDLNKRKKDNHITFEQFQEVASKDRHGINISDKESQLVLSNYLHSKGYIQHYQESDALYDFVILNPQWAVDAVYTVLKDKKVSENKGRFTTDDLKVYWAKFSETERAKLINLMLKDKFEICYRSTHDDHLYISPQLLPSIKPSYAWDNSDALRYRFQYPFMPKGLISRLIVRLNDMIAGAKQSYVWNKGMVIKNKNCMAQIIMKRAHNGLEVLDIEVIGDSREKKYLLYQIKTEVFIIHSRSFKNIRFNELIPCNCQECLELITPHYFNLDILIKRLNKGKSTAECDVSCEDVKMNPLIEGIDMSATEETERVHEIHSSRSNADFNINIGFDNSSKGQMDRIESKLDDFKSDFKNDFGELAFMVNSIREEQREGFKSIATSIDNLAKEATKDEQKEVLKALNDKIDNLAINEMSNERKETLKEFVNSAKERFSHKLKVCLPLYFVEYEAEIALPVPKTWAELKRIFIYDDGK